MKDLTREWVTKAEGDFRTASREMSAAEAPNYDAVAFHAQQCAEKYLKARLIEAGTGFPKSHDLTAILNLIVQVEPTWEFLRQDLAALTDLGVEVRYPGAFADEEDAAQALQTAFAVRGLVRRCLGLEETPS
jgi:HEPN domain-containing protein